MATDQLPPEVLDDVVELLVGCHAFAGVDRAVLEDLAADAEIAYVDGLTTPLSPALVVQRGGVMIRDRSDRTVDMVAVGEFSAPADGERLVPVEPSMVVCLPERAIDIAWSADPRELARLVARPAQRIDLQTAAARTVMRSPVHTARPNETCADVAKRMNQDRVSSIVVLGRDRMGIVTDRDIRSRLVAQGLESTTPIGHVATWDVHTIEARTPVFELLIVMLSEGIHHLPVIDGGRLVGMISSRDVLELGGRSPLHLRTAVDRAQSVEQVAAALDSLAESVRALLAAGTTAGDVGRVIATVTDRVQRQVLQFAFDEHGAPPSSYGWIAFGSQARREQTLHSDQDHGLVLPDGLDAESHDWWATVAGWVVDALERCGYARCGGGVMASERAWRHDITGWRGAFADWIERPSERHLMESTIAFDLRRVTGGLDGGELLGPVIATAAGNGVFLGRLARDATRHGPPLGFFGRFAVARSGEHRGRFDVKAGVMLPIADIARLHAIARGAPEVSTDRRLAGAADAGQVSPDLVATLRAGYELATALRLRGHLQCYDAGVPPHNWLDPDELQSLARAQLRETFKAIRTAQQSIESRYHTGMLG